MQKMTILMTLGMSLFAIGAQAARFEGKECEPFAAEHARAEFADKTGLPEDEIGHHSKLIGGYLFEVTVFGPDVTDEDNSRIYEVGMNDACELGSFEEVSAK